MDASSRLRIVVLGYVVRGPVGGLAWHYLQYAAGLDRLGHEVLFVEDSDDYPSCYDPNTDAPGTDPTYGLNFAAHAFGAVGLEAHWAYYDAHTRTWMGPRADDASMFCRSADVLLNVSALNQLRPWTEVIPQRVLIDTDPAFTQIRNLHSEQARTRAARHTSFFSFGECFGQPGCTIPDDGFPWQPTRQPVLLDAWPVTPGRPRAAFTTVMQWNSYAVHTHDGRRFGMKSDSFELIEDLPRRSGERFVLAVGSPNIPKQRLREAGWRLAGALSVSDTIEKYQAFLQDSKAEFSVAKHGYVVSRSGWFSERSAAYLASARPTVLQDTGFTRWLETDRGVLSFSTLDEALAGIEETAANYASHCRAAREVASAYFDSRTVLADLLDRVTLQQA